MTPARAYVICATPRTGSTLLCDLLAATGVAGKPNSFWRRESIPDFVRDWNLDLGDPDAGPPFDRRYLDAVLHTGSGDTGMFGLRLMWASVADLSARFDGLFPGLPDDAARFGRAFGSPLYFHLSRTDKVAQAVSYLRAEQTGLWHRFADGSERERSAPPRPPVYDPDRLDALVDEVTDHDAAWLSWFRQNRIEPVRITYEALDADPVGVLANILSTLRLDPGLAKAAATRTARLADAENRGWAARYRARSNRCTR